MSGSPGKAQAISLAPSWGLRAAGGVWRAGSRERHCVGSVFSSMLDSLLEDAYNENEITEDYVSDAWHDAVRDAAIRGLLSGVSNAFDDAKKAASTNAAKAIDRVTQASNIRKIQKDMRQLYVGTAQQDAESYASLVRLLEKKGNGRRW